MHTHNLHMCHAFLQMAPKDALHEGREEAFLLRDLKEEAQVEASAEG
jgi:hypothetical protein